MNEWYSLTGIGNMIIGLLLLVGGYMALRSGKHQKVGEIQGQVIDALKAELEAVQRRIDIVERENTRLHQTINLIKSALAKRGYRVTIDGDMVEISNQNGSSYSHIQEEQPPPTQRRAGQPAPRSQWTRRPWADKTIADLPTNNEKME